jgi:hypothetical protein
VSREKIHMTHLDINGKAVSLEVPADLPIADQLRS